MDDPTSHTERTLPDYYRSTGISQLQHAIKDFDNVANFRAFERHVASPISQNFMIDFGDEEAWCGFDLDASAIKSLLETPVSFGSSNGRRI